MAKIVIAGEADCPLYAKVEALADTMATNLPHFQLHKIVKHPSEWSEWLEETCKAHGFTYTGAAVISIINCYALFLRIAHDMEGTNR